MLSTCYDFPILIKLEFTQEIFEKYSTKLKKKRRPEETELYREEAWTDN